jgi:hypothetical protein
MAAPAFAPISPAVLSTGDMIRSSAESAGSEARVTSVSSVKRFRSSTFCLMRSLTSLVN